MIISRIKIVLAFAFVWFILFPKALWAQYQPPQNVIITMYQLTDEGARIPNGEGGFVPCTQGNQSYGCTVDRNKPYPFNDSNITIGIESEMVNGIQQGYLHNVLSTETPPGNVHPVAVAAQAIAARTYAYWQIDFNQIYGINPIDNSASGFQVYVPFAYDALAGDEKQVVEDALADRLYLSYATGPRVEDVFGKQFVRAIDDPIFVEFNSESVERTIDHPTNAASFPYMHGVADPISSHPTLDPTYQRHGFIQHGASRWAKGNVGWNLQLDREPWAVRWTAVEQILAHYYTSIHIRNANENNRIVTPNRRWVPLQIFGQETPDETRLLCKNHQGGFAVDVQNTGIFNWEADAFELSYRTDWQPVVGQATTAASYLPPVAAGDSTTTLVTINIPDYVAEGTYTITLEMRKRTASGDYEWFSDDGWPGYPVKVMVVEDCSQVYLPLVQAESSTVPSALFPD